MLTTPLARIRRALTARWKMFLGRRWTAQKRNDGAAIGQGVTIARGVRIPSHAEIGDGSNIHRNCVLKGGRPIRIGKFCALAEGVHIVSANHAVTRANLQVRLQREIEAGSLDESKGPVEIGHAVWIGDNAIILSGVTIGNGAVIAAGSVVTSDVDAYAIAAGVPARQVRSRFSKQIIEELEELAWWSWSKDKMKINSEFFAADLTEDGVTVTGLLKPEGRETR